jgi:transposase
MALVTREQFQERRKRVEELLRQGLSIRVVSERTGMTARQVHRVKKALENKGR